MAITKGLLELREDLKFYMKTHYKHSYELCIKHYLKIEIYKHGDGAKL
jgi:hypothetical protein